MERLRDYKQKLFSRHPVVIYMVVFVTVFFYSWTMTMVLPFLPQLVKSYGTSELKVGSYVGVIASSLYVGKFIFSTVWGYLADTLGKKRTLMLTMFCLLASTLAFGFSDDIYWAAVTRFLQGCSMGHLIILKAILADVCDDTNLAWGLGLISNSYSTGCIIGPSVVGFLVFPAEQYPWIFFKESAFDKFPVLLPIIVTATGLACAIVFSAMFLRKDKKQRQAMEDPGTLCNSSKNYETFDSVHVAYFTKENRFSDAEVLEERENGLPDQHVVSYTPSRSSVWVKLKNSKFISLFRIREFLLACLIYASFSMFDIGFLELFPVLAATSVNYNGMGYSTSQTGTVIMAASVFLVPLEFLFLSKLNDRFGSKKVLIGTNLLLAFICPMLPTVAAIESKMALWACLVLLIFLFRACMYTGYLSINILINNAVEPHLRGSANGLAGTFQNIGWMTAPIALGRLYSWSLTNIKVAGGNESALGFPFNQFFPYYLLSLLAVFISVVGSLLPERMNFKKVSLTRESLLTNKKATEVSTSEHSSNRL